MKNSANNTASKRFRSAAREIACIGLAVAVITVCAWTSLPVGPIPFTLQTLAVALVGALLGWKRGTLVPALFRLLPVKKFWVRTALFYFGNLLGLAVCYFFGTVWFVLMYRCSVGYALALCVTPYIIPDLVKLAVAALLAVRLEKYVR